MKNIFALLISVTLFSCGQKAVKEGTYEKASWETKAQVRQLKNGDVHNVSIDVYAIKNEKLRLEATATLGIKVASVVMTREKVEAVLPNEKKIYIGAATQDVLTKALKIPIHPNIFYAMIFDQGLRGPGWVCEADAQGLIKSCKNKDLISIEWERLQNPQKVVHLKTKTFEMDWFFKNLDVDWQPKDEVFSLARPEKYQVIRL